MSRTFTSDTAFLDIQDVSVEYTTNPIVMDTYSSISATIKFTGTGRIDGLLSIQISNKIDSDYEDYEDSVVIVNTYDTYIYNIVNMPYRYIRVKYIPYIGTPDINIQLTRKA